MLSPLLYSLFTNDCRSNSNSTLVFKFSDDTTIEGLITNTDETVYRSEVDRLVDWCGDNNLELSVSKTKEMVIDFRRKKTPTTPLVIKGQTVEMVDSFRFLDTIINKHLKWEDNITSLAKKAQQRMIFLRQLRKFGVSRKILIQFYRAVTESVLTFSITVWFGSASVHDKILLDGIVRVASKLRGCELPSLESIYITRTQRIVRCITSDQHHPAHHLLQCLPSGRRFRTIKTRTSRFKNSFYPKAV